MDADKRGIRLCSSDKGKWMWLPNVKVRPNISSMRSAKLDLDKNSNSSSDSSAYIWPTYFPKLGRGECSNNPRSIGPHSLDSRAHISLVVDLTSNHEENHLQVSSLERPIETNNNDIPGRRAHLTSSSPSPIRVFGLEAAGLQTPKHFTSPSHVPNVWPSKDLDEEIAKVIKRGLSKGYDFNTRDQQDQLVDNWSLDEEVGKVIEVGVSLGFDFNGKEKTGLFSAEELVLRQKGQWGLITLWNENMFDYKACTTGRRYIIIVGELRALKQEAVFCNIYASNDENERKTLWDFLIDIQATFPILWCLGGNFNTILNPTERKGGQCAAGSKKSFNEFILKAKVVDIPLLGS
ncbi:hypothetical protein Dsin_025203 [Dipteronia sinensis]|uniref:Uncharacterized protein n=1 Tax=Dipteronia sinensis TaxID=43782 RepID=A0AAE0DWW3_9ROSI|nr:hypothetical protein Dsin_025203 [Dipteronia sinensis]